MDDRSNCDRWDVEIHVDIEELEGFRGFEGFKRIGTIWQIARRLDRKHMSRVDAMTPEDMWKQFKTK